MRRRPVAPFCVGNRNSRKITLASRTRYRSAMREKLPPPKRAKLRHVLAPQRTIDRRSRNCLTGRKTIPAQDRCANIPPARCGDKDPDTSSVLTATPSGRRYSGWHGRCWRPVVQWKETRYTEGHGVAKRIAREEVECAGYHAAYRQNRFCR